MRNRIAMAVSLIKEAATALTDMPLLMVLPVVVTTVMALFTGIWLTYSVYLASSAELVTHVDETTGNSYKEFSWSLRSQQRIIFLLFCWAWTAGFLQAIGHVCRLQTSLQSRTYMSFSSSSSRC
jgi:Plasma-membrane choline transporter